MRILKAATEPQTLKMAAWGLVACLENHSSQSPVSTLRAVHQTLTQVDARTGSVRIKILES